MFKNFIAGEWVEGVAINRNINPSDTNDVVGEYARADARQAAMAVDAAFEAQQAYRKLTAEDRADAMDRIGSEILARREELGYLLSREEGKTLAESNKNVRAIADIFARKQEETGIKLGEVRYLGSQPWPFPASLMMAFKAHAITTDVRVDGEETMTARWVTRDEYTAELIAGRMAAPGRATIARYMIEEWLGHDLP